MKPHQIWASVALVFIVAAGYSVLVITGHPGEASSLAQVAVIAAVCAVLFGPWMTP